MERIKFYDVKNHASFHSNDYEVVERHHRKFAVAKAPSGIMAWRIYSEK